MPEDIKQVEKKVEVQAQIGGNSAVLGRQSWRSLERLQ